MNEKDRKKWSEVLKLDYMSSEDSEGQEDQLKVRQIPWLSESVQKFKDLLDSERVKNLSAQSKRQMKQKICEGTSQRQKPITAGNGWIYKTASADM